jgi:hypothetical protein
MADERFRGLSDEELADIWYALSGAEIRHPDCFKLLVDASIHELEQRQGRAIRGFLDARFSPLRAVDASEDVAANIAPAVPCSSVVEN